MTPQSPLPPLVAALERRLGIPEDSLEGVDRARTEAALDDASTLILAEVSPALATSWSHSAPSIVAVIALKAARREFDNPRGLRSETLGKHSIGLSESSGVYLTAREVRQIARAASGKRASFVGSPRTPSGPATTTPLPDRLHTSN